MLLPDKSLSWEKRKKHTINNVLNNSIDDVIVVLADKIHNMEDLTNELKGQGLAVFNNFKRGIDQQLWYFENIVNAINEKDKDLPIVKRLQNALINLKIEINYQKELEEIIFNDNPELLMKLRNLNILKYNIKNEGYIKPFIIEILGTPRTGKTTIINNLLDFLKKGGFKVAYFEELVTSDFYNKINHLPLYERNIAIINEIVEQLNSIIELPEATNNNNIYDVDLRVFNNNGDIIVFDRGIYDRLIWFRRLFNNKEITAEQYIELIEKYKIYLPMVNCLLCFTASPEVALKRDYLSSLALEKRNFLTVDNIASYNRAMQDLITDNIITNQSLINTDQQSLTDSAIQTAQNVLKKMKK